MTDDERFEQVVREAAADYEAPRGEVPREAMWNAIRAQRAAAAPPRLAAPVAVRRPASRVRMWMGMAATLLLGVAVGRFAWQRNEPATLVPAATAPAHGRQAAVATTDVPAVAQDGGPSVAIAPRAAVRRTPADGRLRSDAVVNGYTVATAAHLENVEALLTTVAASSAEARTDSLVARWARDLLSNTRLLLDSPAARDPMRARLLQDLEVILVQLVQRSPGGNAEERSSLERTLNRTQIIPRLRSAVPASLHSGTD